MLKELQADIKLGSKLSDILNIDPLDTIPITVRLRLWVLVIMLVAVLCIMFDRYIIFSARGDFCFGMFFGAMLIKSEELYHLRKFGVNVRTYAAHSAVTNYSKKELKNWLAGGRDDVVKKLF